MFRCRRSEGAALLTAAQLTAPPLLPARLPASENHPAVDDKRRSCSTEQQHGSAVLAMDGGLKQEEKWAQKIKDRKPKTMAAAAAAAVAAAVA